MSRHGHAIVLGDGAAPARAALDTAWPGWAEGVTLVVAADGGARLAPALDLRLDRWVGDADSYPRTKVAKLAASGVATRLVPTAKDESDLELAVLEAAEAGVARITLLGALGGPRLDHELANLALLAHPVLAGIDVRVLGDRARVRLLDAHGRGGEPAMADLHGRPGDVVSLLPFGGTVGQITTRGLEYPLEGEPLEVGPARGLSNVRVGPHAIVTIRGGRLLIVETPATVAG